MVADCWAFDSEETGKETQNDLKSDVQDPFSVQWKKFDGRKAFCAERAC